MPITKLTRFTCPQCKNDTFKEQIIYEIPNNARPRDEFLRDKKHSGLIIKEYLYLCNSCNTQINL